MTTELRLLFDECVGTPTLGLLKSVLATAPEKPCLRHILEFQSQGVHDEVWLPRISKDGWIIVTADRGRQGRTGKGEKLPVLCRQYDVTHVMLSKTIHHWNSFQKFRCIMAVWTDIARLASAPKGSAHLLRVVKDDRVALVCLDSRPAEPATA